MALFFNDVGVLQKSKEWSELMEDFPQKELNEGIKFTEINSDCYDGISDDCSPNQTVVFNNNNDNECKALLKVDNSFEGETSSDDIDEFVNQMAAPMVNEQKKKWEECGMLDVLETFDLDKITKIVEPWVEKFKVEKTQHSSSIDEHIVHIEEHHHRQIHVESDNESLHSIDTANYIRSNRKKKSARCATTTIKKFSYFKGSKRQLAKKFGLENLDEIFSDTFTKNEVPVLPQRSLKQVLGSGNCVTPPTQPKLSVPKSVPLPERQRKSRQIKRRSDISKRSISSSSSSSSRSPIRHFKPKYRKSRKSNSPKDFNTFKEELKKPHTKPASPAERPVQYEDHLVNLISTTEDDGSPKRQLQLPQTISALASQNGSSSNETCFSGASIINSTALNTATQSSKSLPEHSKKCLITPIKKISKEQDEDSVTLVEESLPSPAKPRTVPTVKLNPIKVKMQRFKKKTPKLEALPEAVQKIETKAPEPGAEEKAVKSTNGPESIAEIPRVVVVGENKVLLYSPNNIEAHKGTVSGNKFFLTKEYFLEKVGKKNSRRFIKLNLRKFPFEFNCNSRVYFKVYDDSEDSASSDEDVLCMFGREGKLIVEDGA